MHPRGHDIMSLVRIYYEYDARLRVLVLVPKNDSCCKCTCIATLTSPVQRLVYTRLALLGQQASAPARQTSMSLHNQPGNWTRNSTPGPAVQPHSTLLAPPRGGARRGRLTALIKEPSSVKYTSRSTWYLRACILLLGSARLVHANTTSSMST